jgi:hypothetical protein
VYPLSQDRSFAESPLSEQPLLTFSGQWGCPPAGEHWIQIQCVWIALRERLDSSSTGGLAFDL